MTSTTTATRASAADTARLLPAVLLPIIAGGVIKRRPPLMGLVGLLGGDERAVREITRLRDRYGDAPLALRVPGREVAVVLSPADVGALLAGTPDPFTPASTDKVGALKHFQPHAVLITRDERVRAKRRAANEKALDTGRPLHHLAEPIHRVVTEEAAALSGSTLDWDRFDATWQRVVRRIVLGDAARDDVRLTELLDRLRRTANWAWLAPRRPRLLSEFTERLRAHVARADPDTVAAGLSHGVDTEVDPVGQVPHWLFAFDAAGMAIMRTLAVLATHPDAAARAETDTGEPARLPFLRACVLDTLRLWPTTPAILRETTTQIWGLPENTTVLVFAPYFHRAVSNRFEPDLWLDGRAQSQPALVPFSGGPGQCPGRNLVLYTTSTMLAAMRTHREYELVGDHGLRDRTHLPGTLDNFHLEFRATAR
ncbi:cytochrome P450 [Actinophytocola algeriensis]|uniref:Cytochrome P450 n=1 Tax=Actinophytocola algeriensis TaxID=1768010 RepID=A0A7W7VEU6_9PSEU|nr:cytochrome P450 [Actinophytocola algeriensis]MBB4907636.1 cytochrome P450 [Actinophytocola algeriensis]MBE1479666.1 cytochrome P450 [Actinophytocola algeriensis]